MQGSLGTWGGPSLDLQNPNDPKYLWYTMSFLYWELEAWDYDLEYLVSPMHVVVSLNYCSQNGGNLYRAPYYNGNPYIGPRIIGNLDQSPCTWEPKP